MSYRLCGRFCLYWVVGVRLERCGGGRTMCPPTGDSRFSALCRTRATPHNSRLAAQAPLRRLRHGICVAKMLDNVGLRYPHRASGAKAPRTLRPLPLLRFAVSATGGTHLCSIQYYLRFWLSICRTSLAVSALRIMRCCLRCFSLPNPVGAHIVRPLPCGE